MTVEFAYGTHCIYAKEFSERIENILTAKEETIFVVWPESRSSWPTASVSVNGSNEFKSTLSSIVVTVEKIYLLLVILTISICIYSIPGRKGGRVEGEGSTGKVKGLKHVSVVLQSRDCEISVWKKKDTGIFVIL